MTRRFTVIIAIAILVLFASAASAASNGAGSSFYVGAGIGNTFFSNEFDFGDVGDQVQDIDENSTAWKIFGGFSGRRFLGIEGGYRDFGTIKSVVGSDRIENKIKGWDIAALGRIQIAIIDVFAKAGVMFWDSDFTYVSSTTVENETESTSGTDFIWGLGAGARLGPIGVRLEWESLVQDNVDNLSVVSLGATFGF